MNDLIRMEKIKDSILWNTTVTYGGDIFRWSLTQTSYDWFKDIMSIRVKSRLTIPQVSINKLIDSTVNTGHD